MSIIENIKILAKCGYSPTEDLDRLIKQLNTGEIKMNTDLESILNENDDRLIFTNISNYYGALAITVYEDQHYICLSDYDGYTCREISEELYNMMVKELV